MNEEVSSISVPCSMSEVVHGVPSIFSPLLLDAYTVQYDGNDAEKEWCNNPEMNILDQELPGESIESVDGSCGVETQNYSSTDSMNPEEPAPHVSIYVSIYNYHERSCETPSSLCNPSMSLFGEHRLIHVYPIATAIGISLREYISQ